MVLFVEEQPIDTAYLDKNKNFTFEIKLKESQLYHIEIDKRYQYIYLEPNDSLVLFANALNFQNSLSFSGRGSELNNFLVKQLNDIDKNNEFLKKSTFLPPYQYRKTIDSLLYLKIEQYNNFLTENPTISPQGKHIALITTTLPVYKELEAYPFVYERNNSKSIINILPQNFYDYRKEIKYDDGFLSHYRPYYSYIVMYTNNLAFKRYHTKNPYGDINKDEAFHLKKLRVIDSVFKKNKIRDNLYRNAAYSYVFNIQDNNEWNCYIEEFEKYNINNIHKTELEQIFKATVTLQRGSIPPDFDLIDKNGRHTTLLEISKDIPTIYYFWSVNQKDMSNLIFNRILQLKELFPEILFIGIDMGQDLSQWCESFPESLGMEQYHVLNSDDVSRKFLINNISKCLILDKDTRIISAFKNIFSPDLEKTLLNDLNY